MSPAGRACLGALFGALITLFAHPASRPFMLAAVHQVPSSQIELCVDHNLHPPPPPHDLKGASLWLQLAAERTVAHHPLRPQELETMLAIADRGAEAETENAYWSQMKAVLLSWAGREPEALEAWLRASRATYWNDYQTSRLKDARDRLSHLIGSEQAWQLAYVYHERSEVPALLIERYARALLSQAGFDSKVDLEKRYATLVNGEMMRLGSRSVAVGRHGANVVELVAYPRDLVRTPTPKRLWVGQNTLMKNMQAVGLADETARARTIFGNNEGWRALTPDDPSEYAGELSVGSIFSSTVVGACAFAGAVGACIWGLGWLVSSRLTQNTKFSLPAVVSIAVLLACAAGLLSHDIWAGLVGALAGSFLMVAPSQARKAKPEDLGPLFSFLILVLALQCGLAIGIYAVSRTAPSRTLLPQLGIPNEYYSTPLLLGLAFIVISLGIIAVPIWAMVQKIGTPHVLGVALRKLGIYLGYGSLAAGILLGPVAVYADRRIEQTLGELVGNEPLYYLLHP